MSVETSLQSRSGFCCPQCGKPRTANESDWMIVDGVSKKLIYYECGNVLEMKKMFNNWKAKFLKRCGA